MVDIYAVNLEHLKEIARLSLREMLRNYSEYPCTDQSDTMLEFIADTVIYQSRPGQRIRQLAKQRDISLTPEEIAQDPYLSKTISAYIADGGSDGISLLLDSLSRCLYEKHIHQISYGYRRWWMGSFLDYAEQFYGASSETYTRLVRLFQKILRGYDCGKIMQKAASMQPFEADFPLIPDDDVDTRLAVLSHDELRLLMQVVNEVPSSTVFHAPPEKVGIAPDNDEHWNQWVWNMLGQLRVLETLKNEVDCLITLIG